MPDEHAYLDKLPPPSHIHAQIGQRLRELTLLRRMLRLSQAAHGGHTCKQHDKETGEGSCQR